MKSPGKSLFVGFLITAASSLHAAFPAGAAGNYTLFGGRYSPNVDIKSAVYGSLSVSASGAFTFSSKSFEENEGSLPTRVDYNYKGKLNSDGRADILLRHEFFVRTFHIWFQGGEVPSYRCFVDSVYIRDPEEGYSVEMESTAEKRVPAAARAGRYTALYSSDWGSNPPTATEKAVEGQGWAVIRVQANGLVSTVGRLASQRPFSYSSALRADGDFWFYTGAGQLAKRQNNPERVTYQNLDVVTGSISLNSTETSDGDGKLDWIRNNGGQPLKVRTPDRLQVVVSRYVAPPKDSSSNSYVAEFGEGVLDQPVNASFSLINTPNGQRARALTAPFKTFALPASTGLLGSFAGTLKLASQPAGVFSGVFLHKQGYAGGYFSGAPGTTNQSGYIRFTQNTTGQ